MHRHSPANSEFLSLLTHTFNKRKRKRSFHPGNCTIQYKKAIQMRDQRSFARKQRMRDKTCTFENQKTNDLSLGAPNEQHLCCFGEQTKFNRAKNEENILKILQKVLAQCLCAPISQLNTPCASTMRNCLLHRTETVS